MNLKLEQHLNNLPMVLDSDGGIAPRPSSKTIANTKYLLESLNYRFQATVDPVKCITASPAGNITIDWYYLKSFVSVEVGEEQFSFYADLPDGSLPAGNTLPALEKCLGAIYKK